MSAIQTTTYGTATDFSSGLKEDLDLVFMDEFNGEERQFEKVFHVSDTKEFIINESKIQGPSLGNIVSEGGSFVRLEMVHIHDKTYQMATMKNEMKITREALDYLRFQEMKDAAKELARTISRTVDRYAQLFIANGFGSSLAPNDSLSLFNTAHALGNEQYSQTTVANRSNLSLNATNLASRRVAMRQMRNENGDPCLLKPNRLITGPNLEFVGAKMVAPGSEPGTGNNDPNVAGRGLEHIVLDCLADPWAPYPNMWVLQDSKAHKLKFFWGKRPVQWVDKDPNSADYLYRIECRFAYGCSDFRGVDGNTGEV